MVAGVAGVNRESIDKNSGEDKRNEEI